ncbi:hypothetical protein RRF55_27970, partial [Klebsiella sp. K47]|uniref:hypothetical protein n=1 Tax=Klebsiella sp. K47 TaxID=3077736 RepID=UPI003F4600DA
VLIDPATEPRFLAKGTRWTVSYVDDDMSTGKVLARQEFIVPGSSAGGDDRGSSTSLRVVLGATLALAGDAARRELTAP